MSDFITHFSVEHLWVGDKVQRPLKDEAQLMKRAALRQRDLQSECGADVIRTAEQAQFYGRAFVGFGMALLAGKMLF